MKKLILVSISLALFAGQSVAQYVAPMSGAELKYRMSMDAPQLYQKYQSGSKLAGFGAGLTIGGLVAIVVGAATADKETVTNGVSTQVNLSGTGGAVFAAGVICALVGVPVWTVGNTKKKNAKNAYLKDYGYGFHAPVPVPPPSPHLQLNTSSNGLGLAFVF